MPKRMSKKNVFAAVVLAGLTQVFAASSNAPATAISTLQTSSPQRELLNAYCVTCHNEKTKTAGLLLDKVGIDRVPENAAVWEKVAKKLRVGAMPPPGAPRPTKANYDFLAAYIETELDRTAAAKPNPGRPAIHRLNRTEYSNAVRDLLNIDTEAIDIKMLLPADDTAQGFDNIGAALSISPRLMERYVSAALKITRIAVGDRAIRPAFETYTAPKFLIQDQDRMDEDLPFGSRGGIAVRHHFPANAEYTVQVRLQRMYRDYIRGLLDEQHQMEITLDGERINLFKVGGEKKGRTSGDFTNAGFLGDPEQEEYERTADKDFIVRVRAAAGTHVIGITFLKKASLPEGPLRPRLTLFEFPQFKAGVPSVGEVIIGGPYDIHGVGDTASRRRIFECRPNRPQDEEGCARRILSNLARRAYRRPVTPQDLTVLVGFYNNARTTGDFESGIAASIERILLDPEFLFRIERDPRNAPVDTAYRLSDLELASRLSFFLWSTIPDEELLSLAERGRLKDPAVLEQQLRRMLNDFRSTALVNNFAGQWLLLRNLNSFSPDPKVFPYFDDNLRDAFRRETELFVESVMRDDRSVTDLLNADYTFVNERLAQHYGIPNIYGSRFRRVALPDQNRRGLLGHGSILTVTSYPNRTAPTVRGKWILENVLGAPPPPPPPDVPDLKDNSSGGKILTMRERMEQHRANPACATCHRQMDPLGFALENFDGSGRWRSTEGGSAIDSSGVLPDGEKFRGPAELRQVLLGKREQFVAVFTEKLLTYALGRGLEYYDAPTIRKIIREASPSDYRWSSIILGIIKSVPFQMRRPQSS
jgi:mono/diheme cytochrome c family protein